MTDIVPIRTIHGRDARWALQAKPGDPIPEHPGHFVREYSLEGGASEIWVHVRCSCGETFGGQIR